MIGEFLLLMGLGILALPVVSLVLSIKALRAARRVEERLDGLRGALRAGASSLRESDVSAPVPRPVVPPPVAVPPAPEPPPAAPADPFGPPIKTTADVPAQPTMSGGSRPPVRPPEPAPIDVGGETPAPVAPWSEPPAVSRPAIDWEKFTGVKLFSWIGGFALFLGAVYFAKYSIDHGWVTPAMRIAFGFAAGAGALLLGLRLRERVPVTAQTLVAAGTSVLYATAFAAHSLYGFIGATPTFLFLSLVTVMAFLLAVRLDSRYVALLALVGGFLNPPLLSTGVDRAFGLFSYVTLLDVGLLAVVLQRGWGFLWGLGAFGTAAMVLGWHDKFFVVEKMPTAAAVFLWFPALFVAARHYAERRGGALAPLRHAAGLLAVLSVLLGGQALERVGARAALPFLVILGNNALTAALALKGGSGARYHLAAGGLAYLILLGWTQGHLTGESLPLALAAYLVFGVLHGALAVVLHRRGAPRDVVVLSNLFPVLLLLPLALGVAKDFVSPALLWPALFAVDVVAVLAALATGFFWSVAAALGFTFFAALVWIDRLTVEGASGFLLVVAAMAALFFGVGYFLLRRSKRADAAAPREGWPEAATVGLPAASAFLPFLLLAAAAGRLAPADPSSLYGLGALLLALLLGLVRRGGAPMEALSLVALGSAALLEYAWFRAAFTAERLWPSLLWHAGFAAFFLLLPFVGRAFGGLKWPWIAAALSGPIHGMLFYRTASAAGLSPVIGALPALGAVVYTAAIPALLKRVPPEDPRRKDLLALFGGVALLFVSLIFPLQFEKQWITLGWALEGAALLWFYRRVDHPGLKIWAFALLAVAFLRLAANPTVLSYHPRTETRLLNWYLYAYGVTAACQFVSARLWRPSDQRWGPLSLPGTLNALGGVLLFLLMNIQIADYFSEGNVLTFDLGGSLAQDLAYTLTWGLFGLGLLLVGLWKNSAATRWASFGLLGVTVAKLFLHDIRRLTTLYKAAAFGGLAVVLILGSFLYQRALAARGEKS